MGIVYMTSTTSGWKKKIIVACYLLVYFLRDSYIAIKCRFIKKKKKKREKKLGTNECGETKWQRGPMERIAWMKNGAKTWDSTNGVNYAGEISNWNSSTILSTV